jgi:sigma-54 dependent transcriptional regulator, acetoin dehydrogenase operon transcriptional activator AcoR
MTHGISSPSHPAPLARLDGISRARKAVLTDGKPDAQGLVEPWIARSWRRCLGMGQQPHQAVHFEMLPRAAGNRAREANRQLAQAARQVLDDLGRALADTRYFAILTNADGVVIDRNGPIDRSDRRADLITRIGVDLSERSVGTTAIGAVLSELQPVWLHRGEHFFDDTAAYSCAGAPLFGPTGECVGMLDLTGVDVPERPELLHLAVQSARGIENALALAQAHDILLRLNWPGHPMGSDADGLVGLDADGVVTTCNHGPMPANFLRCPSRCCSTPRAGNPRPSMSRCGRVCDCRHWPSAAERPPCRLSYPWRCREQRPWAPISAGCATSNPS